MDKVKPSVTLMLDKERTISLSLNAMVLFEDKTGRSLLDGAFQGTTNAKELRTLLWACLIEDDPSVTEQMVGQWINIGNIVSITEQLNKAIELAMPDKKGEAVPLASPPSG